MPATHRVGRDIGAGRWARLVVALLLTAGVLAVPQVSRADPSTSGGWTTSATATPTVAPGGLLTVTTLVTAASARRALVDVEIHGPSGHKVAQQFWDEEDFAAGVTRSFRWTWSVPAGATPGDYVVAVGIFNPGWGELWHWNDRTARVRVDTPPATTLPTVTTTTSPTTTMPPTTTTTPATTTTVQQTTTTSATTTTTAPTTTTIHSDGHHHVACPGERDQTPLGALPPARPMLCDQLGAAVDTALRGSNSWVDDFNHGATMGALPPSYVQGHVGPGGVSEHFIHNDHWMVDIRSDSGHYPTLLAAWMRPATTFRPKADGTVVIEFEVATPIAGTRDVGAISDSWPEFAISTAPAPRTTNPWGSPFVRNGTYFYEAFAGSDVMGCRMQQSRHPICAFYRADSDGAGAPDRLWEINQNGTDVVTGTEYGGDPTTAGLGSAWSVCSRTDDPDTVCRNTFRITLSPTRVRIDVKKPGGSFVRYYEAVPCNDRDGCSTGQMGRILNHPDGFYVFFADFAYRIANDEVIRFHWDRVAVNP